VRLSGEVFSVACEDCFDSLDAPPKRICARPAPNAFSPKLENRILPDVERGSDRNTRLDELLTGAP